VDAINRGRSTIGGLEPGLDEIVRRCSQEGLLFASHDYSAAADADVALVCIQTDKDGNAPDYRPLFEGLDGLAAAFRDRPAGNIPLVIIESTLAPSSMTTVVRERFAAQGLEDGRDVLLANSPNRVMPGRLVERVRSSDKLVAGLHPATPELVSHLYGHFVTQGRLLQTNSMTAEVVKTFENAYRDVRIAFAAEVARHCDAEDIDFFALREQVNQAVQQADEASRDSSVVPTGGVLVPTIGVGGHCLPKDGILLWWRYRALGGNPESSLILRAREINDSAPGYAADRTEYAFGVVRGRTVALLGVAYRGDSEDTRNSPTLSLAAEFASRGARITLHDPYVYPTDQNLLASGFAGDFTDELPRALTSADVVVLCTPHQAYATHFHQILGCAPNNAPIYDGCNLLANLPLPPDRHVTGIGRGANPPDVALVDTVVAGFRLVEQGVAHEMAHLLDALNASYADSDFNVVRFSELRRLAATCITGCNLPDPVAYRLSLTKLHPPFLRLANLAFRLLS
jgi:UDP-N-acetyl-D-mannosaminuronic acid dehydrogenase